jgi:hypothetical protein
MQVALAGYYFSGSLSGSSGLFNRLARTGNIFDVRKFKDMILQ